MISRRPKHSSYSAVGNSVSTPVSCVFAMSTREMRRGVVKTVARNRRFGFIDPDDSDSDIFVHNRCVHGIVRGHELFWEGGREIEQGQDVLFQTEWDPRKQKLFASSCFTIVEQITTEEDNEALETSFLARGDEARGTSSSSFPVSSSVREDEAPDHIGNEVLPGPIGNEVLSSGTNLKVVGLRKDQSLNGRIGRFVTYQNERLVVELQAPGGMLFCKAIKKDNLHRVWEAPPPCEREIEAQAKRRRMSAGRSFAA